MKVDAIVDQIVNIASSGSSEPITDSDWKIADITKVMEALTLEQKEAVAAEVKRLSEYDEGWHCSDVQFIESLCK